MKKATSIAIVEQQSPPINLVAADVYFGLQDPELAGLAVVMKRGDSMVPVLQSGDYALIDTRDTHVGAGIFALLIENDNRVTIYKVQRVYQNGRRTGRISCTPCNPHYRPFEVTLGEEAQIVGRVVQKITRHL